jgi:hypothetical protein
MRERKIAQTNSQMGVGKARKSTGGMGSLCRAAQVPGDSKPRGKSNDSWVSLTGMIELKQVAPSCVKGREARWDKSGPVQHRRLVALMACSFCLFSSRPLGSDTAL